MLKTTKSMFDIFDFCALSYSYRCDRASVKAQRPLRPEASAVALRARALIYFEGFESLVHWLQKPAGQLSTILLSPRIHGEVVDLLGAPLNIKMMLFTDVVYANI